MSQIWTVSSRTCQHLSSCNCEKHRGPLPSRGTFERDAWKNRSHNAPLRGLPAPSRGAISLSDLQALLPLRSRYTWWFICWLLWGSELGTKLPLPLPFLLVHNGMRIALTFTSGGLARNRLLTSWIHTSGKSQNTWSWCLPVFWKGPKGIPGKGTGKSTLKIPWNLLKLPESTLKSPSRSLKFMTFSTFSLCPLWVCPLHPSKF